MLARYWHGDNRMIPFRDIDVHLSALIRKITVMRPQQKDALTPFWQMQNELGIWELSNYIELRRNSQNSNDTRPLYTDALKSDMKGGFTQPIYSRLINDKVFLLNIVFAVLCKYFPKYQHIELLEAIGIPDGTAVVDLPNRESIIDDVLEAYRYCCAVCEFSNSTYYTEISLEVAHIKWESAGGPDTSDNRMVFCSLHRNLFDFGAFTLSGNHLIEVSDKFKPPTEVGNSRLMSDYSDKPALIPCIPEMQPGLPYLAWHRSNVFK